MHTSRARFSAIAAGLLVIAALLSTGCGSSPGTGRTSSETPQPTKTGLLPTFTPNPLTPTATSEEQHLDTLVWQSIGSGPQQIQTTYDRAAGLVNVAIAYGGSVPTKPEDVAAAQERVKTDCFEAMRVLWTSAAVPFAQANVTVLGPVIDQYADITSQAYGGAYLKAATATRITWSALTPDTAWTAYDNVYLRPDYNDAD
ncbi:MAG TPA: hypothetical protein VF818_06525 [Ktedonobacterales bacterium]